MPSRMLKTEWGEFGYKMATEIITRKKLFKRKRKMWVNHSRKQGKIEHNSIGRNVGTFQYWWRGGMTGVGRRLQLTTTVEKTLQKCPQGCPYNGEKIMQCPNGCPRSGKKHDEMPSRVQLHVRKHEEYPLGCCYLWQNVMKCHLGRSCVWGRDEMPSSVPLSVRECDEMPLRVQINVRKCDEMPSRVQLCARKCNEMPSRVLLHARKWDEMPSSVE